MNTAHTKQRGMPKRTRIQGHRSRLGGIDAELDQNTGEILRTFDPVTREPLLEFPAGSLPVISDYQDRPWDLVRDSGLIIEYSETEDSLFNAAQKLMAYAVIRDRLGLPPQSLILHDNYGWSDGTAKFLNQESAALMAMAGVAWDARNGVMPTTADLERPLETLSKTPEAHYTRNEKRLPIAEVIKWRMSEAVALLNPHVGSIYGEGWLLSEDKSTTCIRLKDIMRLEMSYDYEMNPRRFDGITPFSFTVS